MYISIAIHEFGHYISCKTFGVPVSDFSIGLGPTLIKFKKFNTTFKLKPFPFGGYIKNTDNDLNKIHFLKEWIIILSGIFLNLVVTIVCLSLYFNKSIPNVISILFTKMLGPILKKYITLSSYFGANLSMGSTMPEIISYAQPTQILLFLGVINLMFFAFNLLPLPPLDGGQLYMCIARRIAHKSPKHGAIIQQILSYVNLVFFILIFSPIIINELLRFVSPIQLTLYSIILILFIALIRVIKQTNFYKNIVKKE